MPEHPLSSLRAQFLYQALAEPVVAQNMAPLAQAVVARQVLERTLEEVTEAFAYRVDFDGPYSRLVFAQQELGIPAGLCARLHAARRHVNKLVHGSILPTGFDKALTLGSIASLIEFLSGQATPAVFLPFKKASGPVSDKYLVSGQVFDLIRLIVVSWAEVPNSQGKAWVLKGQAEAGYANKELMLEVLIKAPEQTPVGFAKDLTYIFSILWPYARVHLLHFYEKAEAPGVLHPRPEAEIILDPDYLVDASDLAGCFTQNSSQPLAFFFQKLLPQAPKGSLFKGTIVNDLLDMALEQAPFTYKEAFAKVVKDNFIKTASLGRRQLTDIYTSIKEDHVENLQAFAAHYTGKSLATEPSYISPRFGLSGRMDIVVHDPEAEPTRWEVVELKSGKPPRIGIWKEHTVQALVYNMLLDSVAIARNLPARTGATEVFYSQAETKGRVVPDVGQQRHAIHTVRNYIIGILRQLRMGFTHPLQILVDDQEALSAQLPLRRENMQAFAHGYGQADAQVQAYYTTWLAFLLREMATAKTGEGAALATLRDAGRGGYAGLWRDSLPRKRQRFELLEPLKFETLTADGLVTFAYTPAPDAHSSLRTGDVLVLYPFTPTISTDGEDMHLQPAAYQLVKGTLVHMQGGVVQVQLRSRVVSAGYFLREALWVAEPDHLDSSHWHSIASLFHFLQAPQLRPGYQDIILGRRGPAMPDTAPIQFSASSKLIASQQTVVQAAVQARDFYLLQGPPGTGKTSAALPEIVLQELARGRKNVTILCYTNRALQEVELQLERLKQTEGLVFLPLKKKARTDDELAQLLNGRPFNLETVAEAVGQTKVFLCTISSFLSNVYYLQQLCGALDLLIVDEASMATEAQLVGILPFFAKWILIGDENQLPPVIVQAEVFCKLPATSELAVLGFKDLRHSLFERLLAQCRLAGYNHAYGMLTDHFRMHPMLADLVNPYYNNRLHAVAPYVPDIKAYWQSQHPMANILGQGRTLFIETGAAKTPKLHPDEAATVAQLVTAIQAIMPDVSIGILSPWRAQNRQIAVTLGACNIHQGDAVSAVKIDTIERYQGSERDIIIVSTALSEARFLAAMQSVIDREALPQPYTSVDRKLVVAASRARQQFILLGHAPFLAADAHYGPLLKVIERRGCFITRQQWEAALLATKKD